jgi:molybdate transport system substrate-binding protein
MALRRIILVTIACALATLGVLLAVRASYGATTLLVHAGAGIRPPLDELGKKFEERTGIEVEYGYKGSGCLLAEICFSQRGDLYIPGELFYVEQARERGFVEDARVVAQMSTVVIVQKGNPKEIRGLKDLTRPGLRLGMGDPEAVAVGRAANETLVKAGILKDVEKNVEMRALNVVELGIGVKLKHLDGAIVWDAIAHLFEGDVETLTLPDQWRTDCPIPVAVLKFSSDMQAAKRFLSFLASEEAAKVFVRHGYGLPPEPKTSVSEG